MKIYIYRYGSLCEPDIIDAFKRIGLEIVEESAEIYNKSIIPSESAALASSVLTKEDSHLHSQSTFFHGFQIYASFLT